MSPLAPPQAMEKKVRSVTWINNTKVTRIHGVWYDLTNFLDDHPGGRAALQLAYTRDSTVLFMSSHPISSVAWLRSSLKPLAIPAEGQAYLDKKYPAVLEEFPDGKTWDLKHSVANLWSGTKSYPNGAINGIQQDAYEAEVKTIVYKYFEAEAKKRGVSISKAQKCPPERWAQLALMLAVFLVFGAIPMYFGMKFSLVVTPTLLWILSVNFFHDAAHFAMSSNWRVNSFLAHCAPHFSSPIDWYHQHVIGHHVYTNIPGKDPDLYHIPVLLRFDRDAWYLPIHRVQQVTQFLVWIIAVPFMAFQMPLEMWLKGTYNDVVPLWPVSRTAWYLHILERLFVAACVYGWPWFNPYVAGSRWAFAIIPHLIFSMWFMLWSQINHHTEDNTGKFNPNWYRHQAATSHNVAPQSLLVFILSGGLNLQIEHHLFPCINHWHLRKLQPLIHDASMRHGVHYTVSSTVAGAVGKLWKHMGDMSVLKVHKE